MTPMFTTDPTGQAPAAIIQLINELGGKIGVSRYPLLSPHEEKANERITEADWDTRLTQFVNAPENTIPNVGIARDLTRALLTAAYADVLARPTVDKHTRLLKEIPVKPTKVGGWLGKRRK